MQQTDQPLNQSIHPDNTIEPKGFNQLGIFKIVIAVVVILLVISAGIYWLISNLSRDSSQTLSPSQQQTTTPYIQPSEVPTARELYFVDIIQQNCRIFGEGKVAESMEHKSRYMRLEDLPVKIDSKVAAKIVSNRGGITPDKNYPVVCSSFRGKYHLGIEGDNFIYLSIITAHSSDRAKKVIKESDYGSLALVYENVATDAPQSEFIFAYGEKNFILNKDETLYITLSLRLMDEKDPRFEEIKKIILNKDSPLFNDLLYAQLSQSSAEKENLDFVEEVLQGITAKSNFFDQTQSIDTSDWQTYHNEEFGFEVKYPKNFFSKLYPPNDRKEEVLRMDFAENKWRDQGVHNPALQLGAIRTNLSPREWLDKNYDPLPPNYNDAPAGHYQQVSDTVIDGKPALKFNLLFTSGSNVSTIIKKEPDLLYYFGAHSSSLGTFSSELYDQILSTFRFTP